MATFASEQVRIQASPSEADLPKPFLAHGAARPHSAKGRFAFCEE
jgi:hypothetical protein